MKYALGAIAILFFTGGGTVGYSFLFLSLILYGLYKDSI